MKTSLNENACLLHIKREREASKSFLFRYFFAFIKFITNQNIICIFIIAVQVNLY